MFRFTCIFGLLFLSFGLSEQAPTDASGVSEIHVSAEFLAPGKLLDPELKICTLSNGLPVACTTLEVCVKHGQLSQNVDLEVEYTLDSDSRVPRLYFLQPEGMFVEKQVWPLDNTNTGACIQRLVFVRDYSVDMLSPIAAEVKFSVRPTANQTNAFTKFSRDVLNISRNCGEDDYCEPNLRLDVLPNFPTYIVGSGHIIELAISVANIGEDSFQTYLNITVPEDVVFVQAKMVTNPGVICHMPNDTILLCDIGNPLRAGSSVQFVAAFQPIVIDGISSSLDFAICLNTSAPEEKQRNSEDHVDVSIAVQVSTKLRLEGLSDPEKVTYKKSDYENSDVAYLNQLGPKVVHKYAIVNEALAGVEEIDVRIILLNATSDGKDLVYLTEEPIVMGDNVTCEAVSVNPDNYKVESDEEEKAEEVNDEEKPEEDAEKESDEEEAKSRRRRHIALIPTSIDMIEAAVLSQCKEKQCKSIRCKVRMLMSQDAATIALESRVNVRSFKEVDRSNPPTVGSIIIAEITKLPFIGHPGHLEIYSKQVSTDLVPEEN